MAVGDYDLVVLGSGVRARAIALQAAKLRGRVALVTLGYAWDRDQAEQVIDQVRLNPVSLFHILGSWQAEYLEDLEFLQACGVDVILGKGEFCDRHTFLVTPIADRSDELFDELKVSSRKLRSRRFVIVQDQTQPLRKIIGLQEVAYLTYDSLFELLRRSNLESLSSDLPHLTIFSGDVLSCAIAQLLHRLGVKVQIIAESRILPDFDLDITRIFQTHLEVEQVEILTGIVTAVSDQKIWLTAASGTQTLARSLSLDQNITNQILVPTFHHDFDLKLNLAEVKVNDGEISINSKLQTTNPHIYLCRNWQDINIILKNCLFLAIATAQFLPKASIGLTNPPIASIGLSEIDGRLRYGKDLYVLQSFEQTNDLQFYKILYRGNGEIVGAHLIGDRAQELLGSVAIMMQKKIKVTDLQLGFDSGAIAEICQEISSQIRAKNWKSFWFKLFS